ncbi:MAG: hypothetical protein WCQ99_01195 [Pseudomonadota bacterium]
MNFIKTIMSMLKKAGDLVSLFFYFFNLLIFLKANKLLLALVCQLTLLCFCAAARTGSGKRGNDYN